MENDKIRALATVLGISSEKLTAALESVEDSNEGERVGGMDHFYFNPNLFMKLHSIDYAGLRALVVPNLKRLRR